MASGSKLKSWAGYNLPILRTTISKVSKRHIEVICVPIYNIKTK